MSNPTITLPKAPPAVDEQYIYRKMDSNDPDYVGSVKGGGSIAFTDLSFDLFHAAGLANEEIGLPQVATLLKFGANAAAVFGGGKNAFHHAAEQNNGRILQLLRNSAAVGMASPDLSGRLPVHVAAEVGNLEALKALVELGADINAQTAFNLTSLQTASVEGHEKVVKYLLEQEGIQIRSPAGAQFHPLHLAVVGGHLEVVQLLLLHRGVDVNHKDKDNFTAVHHAVSSKNPDLGSI
jgi:ankyrin repeat protein